MRTERTAFKHFCGNVMGWPRNCTLPGRRNDTVLVMKFGGTSIESAEAMERVARIVAEHSRKRPVVVVSAVGGVTNRLLEMVQLAAADRTAEAETIWAELRDLHLRLASELLGSGADKVSPRIEALFLELHAGLFRSGPVCGSPQFQDWVASFGERVSSELTAAVLEARGLPAAHVDARRLILTDNQHGCANVAEWETYARMRRVLPRMTEQFVPVMGGFIGATDDGVTTTLGRGGSDLTASLVGVAIQADEIQIWSDVDGILECDPRVYAGGRPLKSISYEEAFELARLGAKVLYPPAVRPAMRQRIPIAIRNSRRPEVEGTRVVARQMNIASVKAIACAEAGQRMVIALVGRGVRYDDEILERVCSALGDLDWRTHADRSASVQAFSVPKRLAGEAVRRLHHEFFERTAPLVSGKSLGFSPDIAAGIPSDLALAS
jgi:aspartate kinase